MLAEVRLIIAPKEARLLVRHGDDVVEDELWKFVPPISRTEAKKIAEAIFADGYSIMQYAVHGDE